MPKKKKHPPQGSYTDFPILLHVDESGTASWLNGAASYEEAINLVSQKQSYCMQASREQEAREQFNVYTGREVEKKEEEKKKRLSLIEIEAKYGEQARAMSRAGETVEKIRKTLGLTLRETKTLVKEVR